MNPLLNTIRKYYLTQTDDIITTTQATKSSSSKSTKFETQSTTATTTTSTKQTSTKSSTATPISNPTTRSSSSTTTSSSNNNNNNNAPKRLICYHTNWSQYRPGTQKFFPDNIDPSLCTHIIYSFAKMTNYELAAYEWNDENMDWSKGLYQKTIDLKLKNPNLKVLLAIGGWNMGSTEFSVMVHDVNLRSKFVRTSIDFLKKNKFDGLGKFFKSKIK